MAEMAAEPYKTAVTARLTFELTGAEFFRFTSHLESKKAHSQRDEGHDCVRYRCVVRGELADL